MMIAAISAAEGMPPNSAMSDGRQVPSSRGGALSHFYPISPDDELARTPVIGVGTVSKETGTDLVPRCLIPSCLWVGEAVAELTDDCSGPGVNKDPYCAVEYVEAGRRLGR
jgi:hypothetical protein